MRFKSPLGGEECLTNGRHGDSKPVPYHGFEQRFLPCWWKLTVCQIDNYMADNAYVIHDRLAVVAFLVSAM